MEERYAKEMHERLGCQGCFYADEKSLFKRACCTYPGTIKTTDKTGKCRTRRPRPKFYIRRSYVDEPEMDYDKTVLFSEAVEMLPFLETVFSRDDFNMLILSYDTEVYQIVRLS